MTVVRKPGVQKPHWSAVALVEGLLHRPQRAVGARQPLDGGDRGAVDGETANSRQDRIGPAVDQHRAGAADAVLAADVGAGEPQVVAQRVGQQPARRQRRGRTARR